MAAGEVTIVTACRGAMLAGVALALVVAATAGARAQAASAAPGAVSEQASVGTDLQGEKCRWQSRSDLPVERGAPPPANIFCGTAQRPQGSAVATLIPSEVPGDPAARHKLLEHAAADSAAGRLDGYRMSCGEGRWETTSGGLDLMLAKCALNDSEWPQIVVVATIGPLLLRGEGIPSSLPALEMALGRLAGQSDAQIASLFGNAAYDRTRLVALGGERFVKASGDDFENYRTLTDAARVEASRKNYAASEDHYRRALAILTTVFGENSLGAGDLLAELALQISNQERFDEAAALFRRADPIIQTAGTAADRARMLLYQAFDAANRGRFDEALEFAGNAATEWRSLLSQSGAGADQLGGNAQDTAYRGDLAFSLDLAAEMALRTGNLSAADSSISEAELLIGQTPGLPPWWRAEILTTVGELRAAQGRLDDADASFRAAVILDERLFGDTAPTATTYLVIGRVFADQQLYGESVRAFRLALAILRRDEVARSEVIVDQIAPLITAANEVAKADPSQRAQLDSEIFEATQLIGRSLVDDTVNRVAARLASAAPAIADLVDQLERTRRERDAARIALAQAVSLPDDQRGSVHENELLAQINAAAGKAESLSKQIETQFPDYSKFANPGPVALADAQKELHGDEALVIIEAGRERSYALLLRKDSMLARPVGLDAGTIADDVASLRKAFVVRDRAIDAFDTAGAYSLYRTLFGAIEPGLNGVHHLIVVPTGPLASLPFSLLVTKNPSSAPRDYVNAQWLLRQTAISEVPSARAFVTQREEASSTATRPLLAVANPNFSGGGRTAGGSALDTLADECRDAGPVPPQLLRALPPLPDTAGEVRKVADILHADNGSILMGSDATEPRFRGMPLNQYRVIYFATHGLLPTALRCQSEPALVLSPPAQPAASRAADGVLDASEVAQLRLDADLVVLSACNTATAGGQLGGESLSGLAGAFFHAGARAVLASHWEVPSAQTVDLMTGLFERLGPNFAGGVAEALRQSQLAIAAKPQTAHPFFWAAFTLIGDGGSNPPRRNAENAGIGTSDPPSTEKH